MKDFKQNTKMSCEGNHYKKGGKVKKMANGGDTGVNDWYNSNPAKMPSGDYSKPNTMNVDGKAVELNAEKMPTIAPRSNLNRQNDLVYRPGPGDDYKNYKRGIKTGGKVTKKKK